MIDPIKETVISLADAARLLPARRKGKRPHISCLYRWTTSGCKGVILESLQCGGTRVTSREALARFFQALSLSATPSRHATPARRRRAAEAAERQLQREGV